jgi:hypothetical protein
VPRRFRHLPELIALDDLWLLVAYSVYFSTYMALGYEWTLWHFVIPSFLCRLLTFAFNLGFHPPENMANTFTLGQHAPQASAMVCKAIDQWFSLTGLEHVSGEWAHRDHHSFPSKAQRPGIDFGFNLMIRPLTALGVFTLTSR